MLRRGHFFRRAPFLAAAVLVISVGLVGTVASPALAKKPPKFKGSAPGLVICDLSAKVSFSPHLTESGGGTNTSRVTGGKVSGCFNSMGVVRITKGTFSGSLASSPITCAATLTGASAALTFTWKGQVNGSVGGKTYGGAAKFNRTSASGGSATGSFAGNAAVTLNVPSDLSGCSSSAGISKLTMTGSVTLGAASGGGGGGGGGLTASTAQIASDGQGYCAALTTGGVDCWGDNSSGELGVGSTTGPDSCGGNPCGTSPTALSGITNAVSVVSGGFGSGYCALLNGGHVDCWGINGGALGDGNTTNSDVPVAVSGLTDASSMTSDLQGYCAVLTTGGVDCWGDDGTGQLGDGTGGASGDISDVPVAVSGITDAASISSDGIGYCVVLTTGGVDCWGGNLWGELGNGSNTGPTTCTGAQFYSEIPCSLSPVAVSGITTAASVSGAENTSGGGDSYCAVLTSGDVECWGMNQSGELGNGTTGGGPGCESLCIDTPVAVTGITNAVSLTDDGGGYCAVLSSGQVACWGRGAEGELGNGTMSDSNVPVNASGITTATSLASDTAGFCAVLAQGAVACWGSNADGELGAGNAGGPDSCDTQSCSTVPLSTQYPDATSVASGELEGGYCSILTAGGVACWGDNSEGQLGNGTSTSPTAPTFSVSPDTGLTNGQSVTVKGSSLAMDSPGLILECNDAPDQPSVALGGLVDTSEAVGCTPTSLSDVVETDGTGSLSASYAVATGTIGPPCGPGDLAPCPTHDNAGHSPATDAADYPCPPTPAQEAAGVTCELQFGDGSGDLVNAQILFSGEPAP